MAVRCTDQKPEPAQDEGKKSACKTAWQVQSTAGDSPFVRLLGRCKAQQEVKSCSCHVVTQNENSSSILICFVMCCNSLCETWFAYRALCM